MVNLDKSLNELEATYYETNLQELQKEKVYKDLMIERRQHYCHLVGLLEFNPCSPKGKDTSCEKVREKRWSYIKIKKSQGNKSFTALHPYFNELSDDEDAKSAEVAFSKCLSNLRLSDANYPELMNYISPRPFNDTDFFNFDDM